MKNVIVNLNRGAVGFYATYLHLLYHYAYCRYNGYDLLTTDEYFGNFNKIKTRELFPNLNFIPRSKLLTKYNGRGSAPHKKGLELLREAFPDTIFPFEIREEVKSIPLKLIKNYSIELMKMMPSYWHQFTYAVPHNGVQIRLGDKYQETGSVPPLSDYLDSIPKDKKLFVMTDDPGALMGPDLTEFDFEIISPDLQGHTTEKLRKSSRGSQAAELTSLLVEVDLMIRSDYFVGYFESNISRYIGLMRDFKNMKYVDTNANYITCLI